MSDVTQTTPEQPLPASKFALFQITATLGIAGFYLYCAFAIFLGALAWILALVLVIGAAQYGGAALLGPVLGALGGALGALAGSLRLRFGTEYRAILPREEAPHLWTLVEDLSKRLQVAPPREIFLESGVNAWVQLSGVTAGRGRAKLGVGYDLLTGLSPAEARAVLAHEIAHAKHVRRGYQGFLMRGLARLQQANGTLEAMAEDKNSSAGARKVARVLGYWPEKTAKVVRKLIAVCSRYDEFLADRVAAELCGHAVCRSALLATHVLEHQANHLGWRERLLHLERAPGYTAWLREKLEIPDAQKRGEIENRALERSFRHELDTHPALPDRLAALDAAPESSQLAPENGESAIFWLQNPDATAKRLFGEIERLAAEAERKATASLARWMKKQGAEGKKRRDATVLWSAAGLLFLLLLFLDVTRQVVGEDFWVVNGIFGFFIALLAVLGFTTSGAHNRVPDLPLPTFAAYRAALAARGVLNKRNLAEGEARRDFSDAEKRRLHVQDAREISQRKIARSAELRALLPAGAKPKAALQFFVARGFEFVQKCDYERAALCARLALEQNQKNRAALCLHAICATFDAQDGTGAVLEAAHKVRPDFTARWAVAWVKSLEGETDVAEAFLLPLTAERPKAAIFAALLGFAQAANGKPREALASRRLALDLAQKAGNEEDEACHRFVLAQNVLALGQLDAAREELDWLQNYRKRRESQNLPLTGLDEFTLELEEIRWLLAAGHIAEAVAAAQTLSESKTDDARSQWSLGDIVSESSEKIAQEAAREFYERTLELGWYPPVKIALSRLAFNAEDKISARRLLLESLDTLPDRPFDAAHPLGLVDDVANGLRAIADAVPRAVKAFEAHLDASDTPLKLKKVSLLCAFDNEAEARENALELFVALLPGHELDEKISVERAPDPMQPDGPAAPGIYSCRWEKD